MLHNSIISQIELKLGINFGLRYQFYCNLKQFCCRSHRNNYLICIVDFTSGLE